MRRFNLIIFLLVLVSNTYAQKIATLEVDLNKATNGLAIPASVDLDKLTYNSDSSLSLIELDGNKKN